jgi:hypothetical protein
MLIREQIHLYINYLSFYHNSHKNYLQKLIQKIKNFQQEMEEDITNTNIQPFSQSNSIEQVDLECVFAIAENMNITTILEDSDKIVKDSEEIIEQIENIMINDDIAIGGEITSTEIIPEEIAVGADTKSEDPSENIELEKIEENT